MTAFKAVTIQKSGLWAACHRCAHEWLYSGTKAFANCPSCHTTVSFHQGKDKSKKSLQYQEVGRLADIARTELATKTRLGADAANES